MSLAVYLTREEVPSELRIIDKNDVFFSGSTILTDDDFVNKVLKKVDEAKRMSDYTFIGRTKKLGNLNKSFLSTGTKTLLNIRSNPNLCFDVLECGNNALEFLCDLHEGHVLWRNPFLLIERDDESCDIICRGTHFTNICDFIDYNWESLDAKN